MDVDDLKRRAAREAATHTRSGMVIGLGHGSTAAHAVEKIGELLATGTIAGVFAVPCSEAVADHATRLGIPLTTLAHHPIIDLTIDGADEVDPQLRLIKGGGGALLREKIVAQASRREIIVVDVGKMSSRLGSNHCLPIEIARFGWTSQIHYIEELGAKVALRRDGHGEPIMTDQHNFLVDADFGPIDDPSALAARLSARAGILAHGLFIDLVTDLIVASPDGLRHVTAQRTARPASGAHGRELR